MAVNEELNVVLSELHAAGIRSPVVAPGSRHIQVRWTLPNGDERSITVSCTASDRRAVDNARAGVRRMLRADELLAPVEPRRPERTPGRLERLERRLQRVEQIVNDLRAPATRQGGAALG